MAIDSTASATKPSASGRLYFWAGLGVCVLGLGAAGIQYGLKILIVPWYVPALTTLAVILLVFSLARRRTVTRIVTLVVVAGLAGLQWLFLLSLSRLPEYQGPVQIGSKLPAFQTTLSDWRPFANKDLETGMAHVVVFFRGRW